MDIYLIRHTKPLIEPGICYGISELELAPTFNEELKVLKAKTRGVNNLKIISSPLKRCTILANEFAPQAFLPDNRLLEMNFGEWENLPWLDIMDKYQDYYKKWEVEYVNLPPPGGETFSQLYKRCSGLMDELINTADGNYALITHGGVIRALIAHILDLPLESAFSLGVDYNSVTKISINGRMKTVQYINR